MSNNIGPALRVEIGHGDALVEGPLRVRIFGGIAALAQSIDDLLLASTAHGQDRLNNLGLVARAHPGL